MERHIPTLTDIAILPRWAKVQFLARCAARVTPLIQSQWPTLTASDMMAMGMAGGNADASVQAGREVLVGADALPRVLELIEKAEQEGNMSGFALTVCATAAGLPQVADAGNATRLVASALEKMIQAYAVSQLEEVLVVGSVWDDYVALRDAAQAGSWDDQTPMTDGDLWPHGTPPGWPA